MDWLDLLVVQEILKSLFQHHSSKASILQCSAFFTVQLSHPYMTTGKTITLTRWTFVGKVMALLFSMLSGLVITFLPRSKRLLISWLQSGPSNSFFFLIPSLLRYYCTSLCVRVYSVTLVLSNSSTLWTIVGKVMSLLLNILTRLLITFLPRSKRLLISWYNHHLQ